VDIKKIQELQEDWEELEETYSEMDDSDSDKGYCGAEVYVAKDKYFDAFNNNFPKLVSEIESLESDVAQYREIVAGITAKFDCEASLVEQLNATIKELREALEKGYKILDERRIKDVRNILGDALSESTIYNN